MTSSRLNSIESAVRRLDWARQRIDDFEREIQDFLRLDPYEIINDAVQMGIKSWFLTYRFKILRHPPAELGFRAGEIIHSLRAAVNNPFWSIWKKVGGKGNLSVEFKKGPNHFDNFVKMIKHFSRLPADIQLWYRSEQRHNRPNQEPSLLDQINGIWNSDKHKSAIVVGSATKCVNIRSTGFSYTLNDLRILKLHGLMDGDTIQTSMVTCADLSHFDPGFDLGVSFENGKMGAVEFLRDVEVHIRNEVIPKFEPFLK